MNTFEYYSPIKLSKEEKTEIENKMKEAFFCFESVVKERYGFPNVKKLRNDYKKGLIDLCGEAKEFMEWMIANEQRIIAGYIKMVKKMGLTPSYRSKRRGVSYSDYLQEACCAIYDAMYLYNGKSRFSTYCFWAIKNNIINYNRSQKRQDVVEHHIDEIKQQVFDLQSQGITVEKAVSKLSSTNESVFGTIQKVQSSLLGESRSFQDGDERLLMWKAIEETQLSDLERNLVDNCINGNRGHIARMAETVISPNTGKLYTKQRLSQIFIRACEKIRKTYRTKQKAAA